MPARNSRKIYVDNGIYHIYNRGVEKRIIFIDTIDYKVFLKYLSQYLSPIPEVNDLKKTFTLQGLAFKGVPRQPKNYFGKIDLICYCLMPNHFHFLLKSRDSKDLKEFIQSLLTRYSMYFNKKYQRVGSLFQGRYKAVVITTDNYLLHLSRYIHLNPSEFTKDLENAYSSYSTYLGLIKTPWIKPDIVLNFFKTKAVQEFDNNVKTYKDFTEKYKKNSSNLPGNLILE